MITAAEYEARYTATDARFAHIPLPPGADTPDHWTPVTPNSDLHFRGLDWWEQLGELTTVAVTGAQWSDGQVVKNIVVFLDNDETLTIASVSEAREVAAGLLAAAEEWETHSDLRAEAGLQ